MRSTPVAVASGPLTLRGHLHRPSGAGPFPALCWCHGSEREPGSHTELGRFFAGAGYALVAVCRRGHGESDGAYGPDAIAAQARAAVPAGGPALVHETFRLVVEHHETVLADTLATITWLAAQPFADARRIAVAGVSYGGTQALLAAEAGAPAQAFVAFAPAATAWSAGPQIRERLIRAVRGGRAPTRVLQAANDHDLGPAEVLGAELAARGGLSGGRVYPPFGGTVDDGHGAFASAGMAVWGADVLAFLGAAFAAGVVGIPQRRSGGR